MLDELHNYYVRGNIMRFTIITIYDPLPNYGNRLQNYAVQEVLKKFSTNIQTIKFEHEILTFGKQIKYILQKITGFRLPGDNFFWQYEVAKYHSFKLFNKLYIKTKHISKLSQIGHIDSDYFVVGSDQVWNPTWYGNSDLKKNLYLLTFTESQKKICFSPSFGIDVLPKEWENWFKKYLLLMPNISIREEAGANIINRLTGKRATILIDPTMMLENSEWMNIAKMPKNIDFSKPYVLTYFLGSRSNRINSDLETIAEENKLVVYNLLDKNQPNLYILGPSEFIYLVSKAKLIVTDSFHACVFAFLFQKPFLVYPREGKENNMMSRIDTLLKKFNLERKYVDSGLENELFEANYDSGYRQLTIERQKTIDFLRKSMNLA